MHNLMDFIFKLIWPLIRNKLREADKDQSPILYRIKIAVMVLGWIAMMIVAGYFLLFLFAFRDYPGN